ncbi:mechanosensitive ion channel family protein, partial [Mycobacterium tuberculosis]|nr:mechanosensitive ion channel family protein [Mycobacterium tuberculosis]
RTGEYIDTGKLKGTVERITLRSLQRRHQNGPVHTIPFGQIQSVTNYSRDWSTIKFELRFDRDTDPEKIRKTVKKVGQD